MKKFIYFPSFSAGAAGQSYKKDMKFKDGSPYRFWYDNYPKKYRHEYFLITAGHSFEEYDHRNLYDFTPNTLVLGDSGGYQIATGNIKWNEEIRHKIFEWLEHNSDIAMNIDIPPRGKYEGQFNRCLDISYNNFKYFYENQTGKTQFLNIVQGANEFEYKKWYDKVKDFQFDGWSIGGGRTIFNMMSGLTSLLGGKEHLNKDNKWFHILGTSKISDFMFLSQIQRSLNEAGSHIQVTTDSSSPSISAAFGFYYLGHDIYTENFRAVSIPRKKDLDTRFAEYDNNDLKGTLPILTEVDEIIWRNYKLEDFIEMKTPEYAAVVLHNFSIFQDAIRLINNLIYGHKYILKKAIKPETFGILNAIDSIIKSDDPWKTFNTHRPLFSKYSTKAPEQIGTQKKHEFFDLT